MFEYKPEEREEMIHILRSIRSEIEFYPHNDNYYVCIALCQFYGFQTAPKLKHWVDVQLRECYTLTQRLLKDDYSYYCDLREVFGANDEFQQRARLIWIDWMIAQLEIGQMPSRYTPEPLCQLLKS